MDVIERLGISFHHHVLDLGCGDGAYFNHARSISPSFTIALDIDLSNLCKLTPTVSPDMGNEILKVCADALQLPFPDDCFDRVICSLVLYFLPLHKALFELHRVVRPGGRVYLRVPLLTWGRVIYALKTSFRTPRLGIYHSLLALNGVYYSLSGRQFFNPFLRNEHWAFYVPQRRFEEALMESGFQLEEIEINRPLPYIVAADIWIRKN